MAAGSDAATRPQRIGFAAMDAAITAAGLDVNRRRTYLDDLFVPYIDFYSGQV